MALNEAFVGRSYAPAQVYEVTAERISAFALALGDDNPIHQDPVAATAAGFPAVVAPATFPISFTLLAAESLAADPDLGLDWTRVVHGDQRFAYARPLVAGDQVEVTTTIETIKSMAGNDMITLRGDVTTVDGEHVVSCWSMLVVRAAE
jgi:acyl dehydratase